MKSKPMIRAALFAGLWLSLAALAAAETKVEVSGLHNCCGACLKGITKAVTSAGAEAQIGAGDDTVTITAPDKATAQKAVDNLAAAGYHGTVKGDGIAIKDDSGSLRTAKSRSWKSRGPTIAARAVRMPSATPARK